MSHAGGFRIISYPKSRISLLSKLTPLTPRLSITYNDYVHILAEEAVQYVGLESNPQKRLRNRDNKMATRSSIIVFHEPVTLLYYIGKFTPDSASRDLRQRIKRRLDLINQ